MQAYRRTLHNLELSIGEIVELAHTVRRSEQTEQDFTAEVAEDAERTQKPPCSPRALR